MKRLKRVLLKPYHTLKARSKRRQVDDETKILAVLGRDDEWLSGSNLHKVTGMKASRAYGALARLEKAGMVRLAWDTIPHKKYLRELHKLDRKGN